MRSKKAIALLVLAATNIFAAGYILPNGTILYDNNSQDNTIYKIEKLSPQQQINTQPIPIQQNAPVEIVRDAQPTTVIIEGSQVVYDRPVVVRERYAYGNPVYDIVDAAGTVLVFGLIYDSLTHGFFHSDMHHGMHYGRYHR